MIYRYLDCGILHNGFARVRCGDCCHEFLLAFSCKRRHFCPSCHQKRVVEFGEWLCEEVLKAVPHRHFVFSIPKILRRYFLGACPRPDRGTESCYPTSVVVAGRLRKPFTQPAPGTQRLCPVRLSPYRRSGIFHWDFTPTYISLFPTAPFMKTICFQSLRPLTPKLWSKYSDTRCSRCFWKRARSHRI